jgi:heme/copper-type cytochrome/quinol oxidase subunit 2
MQNDGDLVDVILRYIVIHTVRVPVCHECHVTDEETHSCLNLSIITIMLVVVVAVIIIIIIIIIIIELYNLNRTHRKYIPSYGVRT